MNIKRSGEVICDKCNKVLCKPRKRKIYQPVFYMTCSECIEGKFSHYKFSIHHFGENRWVIRNIHGETWCDQHEWVHVNSSYFQLDPDCFFHIFTFEECVDFIENKFECNLR